jgi:hypothetical protein
VSEGKLVKRRFIRAAPDPLDVAFLSYDVSSKEFRPDCVALIIEESARGGCGLVFRIPVNLNVGQIVLIQLGRLAPLTAEVVWTKSLSDIVQHVGFRFLE